MSKKSEQFRIYKPKRGPGSKFYIDLYDHRKRRHKIAGFSAKRPTEKLAENIQGLVSCRVSGQGLTPELQTWIDHLPDSLVRNFVRWGLLDGQRAHSGKPLSKHLEDWRENILARGRTEKYADSRYGRVSSIFAASGFHYFRDISGSKLQLEISKLKTTVRVRGDNKKLTDKVIGEMTQATRNYYLKACQAFCRWLVQDGRAYKNPLKHLGAAEAQAQKRAALEPDELRTLLAYTETADVSFGLTGPQRGIVYRTAAETGFRSSELRALKVCDFNFKSNRVTLSGEHTKNGKNAEIPLKPATAEKLRVFFGSKLLQAQAFKLPFTTNMAKMFRKDILDAGIEIEPDRGKVNFHGLRHSFGTMLAAAGVHPKDAQELMRHSDINLTMSLYTHTLRGHDSAAINSLPDLDRLPESQKQVKTGTDNKPVSSQENLLPRLLPKSDDKPVLTATNLDDTMTQSRNDINLVSQAKSQKLSEKQGFSEVSSCSSVEQSCLCPIGSSNAVSHNKARTCENGNAATTAPVTDSEQDEADLAELILSIRALTKARRKAIIEALTKASKSE